MHDEQQALVPTEKGALDKPSPLPVFRGAEMAQALLAYKELQRALDQSMPDQLMELDGRPFRKKGYWRAVDVAFNLTVAVIEERREVVGQFKDGRENFGYVVTYRATAPNGRSAPGDGACFAVEKAPKFRCPHLDPERRGRTLHWPAEACPAFDPEFHWRALPRQASEHNIRSHAHTRAYNRAVSNLCGFGEVSAEELERPADEPPPAREAPPKGGKPKRPDRAAETRPAAPEPMVIARNLPPDTVLVFAVSAHHGKTTSGRNYTRYAVKDHTGKEYWTFSQSVAQLATQCRDTHTPVTITSTPGKYGLDLDELVQWQARDSGAGPGDVVDSDAAVLTTELPAPDAADAKEER